MFQTLEATWDRSGRRRWSTLASFTMQALALSLLLAIPLVWVEGPPRLQWIDASIFSPPPAPAPTGGANVQRAMRGSEMSGEGQCCMPQTIPNIICASSIESRLPRRSRHAARLGSLEELSLASAEYREVDRRSDRVAFHLRRSATRPPTRFAPGGRQHCLPGAASVSASWRRSARNSGEVQLRAIVSKTGMIENLTSQRTHMLVGPRSRPSSNGAIVPTC